MFCAYSARRNIYKKKVFFCCWYLKSESNQVHTKLNSGWIRYNVRIMLVIYLFLKLLGYPRFTGIPKGVNKKDALSENKYGYCNKKSADVALRKFRSQNNSNMWNALEHVEGFSSATSDLKKRVISSAFSKMVYLTLNFIVLHKSANLMFTIKRNTQFLMNSICRKWISP